MSNIKIKNKKLIKLIFFKSHGPTLPVIELLNAPTNGVVSALKKPKRKLTIMVKM
jgi:hypothetical protein